MVEVSEEDKEGCVKGRRVMVEGEGSVEAKILAPKEVHILVPGTCKYVHDRRAFADVIKRRFLRWELFRDYLGRSSEITGALLSQRGRQEVTVRMMWLEKDLISCCWLCRLKETISQGMWVASKSWKKKMNFSLEPLEKIEP